MSQSLSDLLRLAASAGPETWRAEHQAELKTLLPDLRRLLIRESLTEWALLCGFSPAAHHKVIIAALEAISAGRNDRLILTLPPGSAKSTYASVLFPAWYLANHPENLIIAASHTVELAERWGRRVRNLVEEHSETLDFGIRSDNAAAGRWETSRGGEYFAAGVGGSIAGRRADCVTGDTIIHTLEGSLPIDQLQLGPVPRYVLSYAETEKAPCFARVLACARRRTETLWRVRTASGRVVTATGDHRFYTRRGWTPSSSLGVGDVLLRVVWGDERAGELRASQEGIEGPNGFLLRPNLQRACNEPGGPWQWPAGVQALRRRHATQKSGASELLLLLRGVPADEHPRVGREAAQSVFEALPGLSDRIPSPHYGASREPINDLFTQMQQCFAPGADEGCEESDLQAWQGYDRSVCGQGMVQSQAEDFGTRQQPLRGVCDRLASRCASHQSPALGQSSGKPRDALPQMPSAISCGGEVEAAADPVVLVERLCQPADVFDLEVEGTHCFFGNGVLVHNCLLIDDPLRSADDADSKIIRDKQWDWWVADAVPRLKPHAAAVIISTRWHEADLVGRLLEEEPGRWKVLNIPMESEGLDDPLGRSPGQRLWPEWFTAEMVDTAKRNPRIWSALYQGRPAPDDGSYFKREWLIDVDGLPDRSTLRVYGGSDYAVTSDGGDYTVHVVIGVDGNHDLYLLDLWRKQASSDEWVEAYCDLVRKWKPMGWAEESGQIKSGVGPFLLKRMRERQAYTVREQFPTRHDKAVRAQSIRGRMAMQGLRILRQASYRNDLIDELLRFPVGTHDDVVDSLGLCGQLLDRMLAPTKDNIVPFRRRDAWDDDGPSAVSWKTV